jgi:hypothetical protein
MRLVSISSEMRVMVIFFWRISWLSRQAKTFLAREAATAPH